MPLEDAESGARQATNVIELFEFRRPAPPRPCRAGYINNKLSTWRETSEWKALAVMHEHARTRVNGLVTAGIGPGSALYADALDQYRDACTAVLSYDQAKARHLPSMIRCAADLLGFRDPPYAACSGSNYDHADSVLATLYVRALNAKHARS